MKTIWAHPPEDLALGSTQVDIWRVSISDFASNSVRWMESILSVDEMKRAYRFLFEADRHRFVVSHTSLRDILSRYLYKSPQDIEFAANEHGKPVISPPTKLDFNLSHSGDFALIGITHGKKIGVDVEKHRLDMEHKKIAQRFFSDKEISELQNLPDDQKITGFFNCWTRKEAYIKAHGLGLLLPLGDFDVSLSSNEPAVLRATRPDSQEALQWRLISVDVNPGYAGAVAVRGIDAECRFWDWDPTQ
ncbi:MAG TPA: 4'-phosphopantetheinyl transferase superfamily protein [Anaerolineales bacterium]|nr:4'-phosphopantetheinyl transferase superfamily protein [Anaerolineales bacterium]